MWLVSSGMIRRAEATHRHPVTGHKIKAMAPGLHFYWPLTTEVEVLVTARQTLAVPDQVMTTKDGKKIVVKTLVVYKIRDIVHAIPHLADQALGREYVSSRSTRRDPKPRSASASKAGDAGTRSVAGFGRGIHGRRKPLRWPKAGGSSARTVRSVLHVSLAFSLQKNRVVIHFTCPVVAPHI